jgi:hypothetical protein
MSEGLIPQDRLTLDLLAEVLAKMYRYSSGNGDGGLSRVLKSESAPYAEPARTPEPETLPLKPDLVQV